VNPCGKYIRGARIARAGAHAGGHARARPAGDRLGHGPVHPGAVKRPQLFRTAKQFYIALLYGRAKHLTAENGGLRPRAAPELDGRGRWPRGPGPPGAVEGTLRVSSCRSTPSSIVVLCSDCV
jgi:hypothetical protein